MSTPSEITQLLGDWSKGDQTALDKLLPLVYDELHRLASSYMRRERPDHTLQTTALVHEKHICGWQGRRTPAGKHGSTSSRPPRR